MSSEKNGVCTIDDIARALGVSKTTVSRAISGKGRIGEETRQRVMEFIEQHDYRPNAVAKSLAQNRTFNLALVLPEDCGSHDMPFFQSCMAGICEVASEHDYDVLVSMVNSRDLGQLERVIHNHKVDGVIVGRSTVDSPVTALLKEKGVPFVVVGHAEEPDILCVDDNNQAACEALTSLLLSMGMGRLALLGGDESFFVTRSRLAGFTQAHRKAGRTVDEGAIFPNVSDSQRLSRAIDRILEQEADCILCMDDFICQMALVQLRERGVSVPGQMRIASFYDSSLLEHNIPPVTALRFDAKALGAAACRTLLERLDGASPLSQIRSDYLVLLRESTKL